MSRNVQSGGEGDGNIWDGNKELHYLKLLSVEHQALLGEAR